MTDFFQYNALLSFTFLRELVSCSFEKTSMALWLVGKFVVQENEAV